MMAIDRSTRSLKKALMLLSAKPITVVSSTQFLSLAY